MPAAIPAAIGILGGVLGSSATVVSGLAGFLSISTGLASGLISFVTAGLQFGAEALFAEQPKAQVARNIRRLPKTGDARFVALGRVRVAGDLTWWDKTDPGRELYQTVVLSYAPISGVVKHYLDGEEVLLDGSGWVTSPTKWANLVRIQVKDGTHTTGWGLHTLFPYRNANDIGRGCAVVLVQQKLVGDSKRAKLYPNQLLEYSALIDGALLPNPAGGADSYSNNPARAVLWHLLNSDAGYGIDPALVDLASFTSYQSVCNATVTLKAGGSEPRYRTNGFVSLGQDRRATLIQLLNNCDADLVVNSAGKLAIVPYYTTSSLTLTDRALVTYTLKAGADETRRYNSVVAVWLDPALAYAENSTPPRNLTLGTYEARNTYGLSLPFCTSGTQAQRLTKRWLYRLNPDAVGEVTTFLHARHLVPGDYLTLANTDSVTDYPLRVERRETETGRNVRKLTVKSFLPEYDAWDETTDELDIVAPPALNGTGDFLLAPTISGATVIKVQYAGAEASAIRVTFPAETEDVLVELQTSPAGADDWSRSNRRNAEFGAVTSDPLGEAASYDYRIRLVGPSGGATDWTVSASPIFVAAYSNTPPVPTLSAATGATGRVQVTVTSPDDPNYYRVEVRYGPAATATWANATFWAFVAVDQPGLVRVGNITGLTSGASYKVFAESQNKSGVSNGTQVSSTASAG